jgi:3-oxoacyl-[acyl-carrier-protein] synthase II
MNKKERRVVITGLGPLSSAGIGVDALWKGILAKDTGLAKEDLFVDGQLWDSFWYHKIKHFDINDFGIDKQIIADINHWKRGKEDRDLNYLLAAVKLALDDSKLKYDLDKNSIGLYVTVEHPGFEPFITDLMTSALSYLEKQASNKVKPSKTDIFKYLYDNLVQNGYDLQTFMYLFLVAKAFGLHGYSLFTSNACASGLFSLDAAARQIKQGQSEVVVVAGGDHPGTLFKHMWFKDRNLYAEDGKIKPFAKDANGIVFGDGASAIILEDLDHAKKRKAHIYAEYLGGGFSLEGWKVTLPQLGSQSYQDAIKQSLMNSKVKPRQIDLVNPHGVGIKISDTYEAKAITDIFGKNPGEPFITALKPYVGHNLGGSALIETIAILLAMQENIIPPSLHPQHIDLKYGLNFIKDPETYNLSTIMKLSCGFAGYNGAVILKKYE